MDILRKATLAIMATAITATSLAAMPASDAAYMNGIRAGQSYYPSEQTVWTDWGVTKKTERPSEYCERKALSYYSVRSLQKNFYSGCLSKAR